MGARESLFSSRRRRGILIFLACIPVGAGLAVAEHNGLSWWFGLPVVAVFAMVSVPWVMLRD